MSKKTENSIIESLHVMNRFVLVVFVIMSLLASCQHESAVNARLSQADSLLRRGLVDSAYCNLNTLNLEDLHSETDSAYYFLLHSEASYRLYKPEISIGNLNYCILHYSKGNGNEEKLATAYYYKGMALYDAGYVKNGIVCLKNAEYIVDNTSNLELRHKVYESMVVVNEEANEFSVAMSYARKSLAVSRKAQMINWQAHAYNNIAVIHNRLNNADSSTVYIKKCMSLLRHISQKDRGFIMNNIGVYLTRADANLAKQYFLQVIKTYPMGEAYINLADIYMREGKLVEAEQLLEKALATADLKVRSEAIHSLFRLQTRRGDSLKALLAAEQLITLKDSMLENRNCNNVKAIQAEFDNAKSKEKYERKIAISLSLIVVLVLVLTIIFLYSRYKTYKVKAAIAMDQMLIKNYEQQVAELQRLGQDKEKEIEQINRRKEKLLDRHRNTLNHGYTLYSEIISGKTTVLWKKHDFESAIEYYRLVDMEFVDSIENGYDRLSPKYMFCLILEHMGKTDQDIMQIMGLADVSLRSVRSRINKKKI